MASPIRVTFWNAGIHEKKSEKVRRVYPEGIHGAIADHLRKQPGIEVVATATLEEPEHGLTEAVLAKTDVLIWWAHIGHDQVRDEIVERVWKSGMNLRTADALAEVLNLDLVSSGPVEPGRPVKMGRPPKRRPEG